MFQQWYDLVYNIFDMGQELENTPKTTFTSSGAVFRASGVKTHYLEEGEGRHTLIFLHGIMMNSNIWDAYLHRFSSCGQVYALDFLGHGLSTKKPDVSLEDLLLQLDTFIEAKKLKNPVLIGHSLGGMIGAIYAAGTLKKSKALLLSVRWITIVL
jgi:pimeloyl-ACP methyl ester carboxylesterase